MRLIRKLLITGGLGFIGSNFIRYELKNYDGLKIFNLDKLTYAGNPLNLKDLEGRGSYVFVRGDICKDSDVMALFKKEKFDAVVNFAAETHVDRSILDAKPFIKSNISGVQVLLEAVQKFGTPVFLQISTDEVYGSVPPPKKSKEDDALLPNSPYAASKASADLLCRAYFVTHKTPIIVTRSSNNYGPFQFPEKFVPVVISRAMEDKPIPVYGKGINVRDWLFVEDNCRAIDLVLRKGRLGEVYNIGGANELRNIDLVKQILKILKKSDDLIIFVKDRPGHDLRYALNCQKIQTELGWKPCVNLSDGISTTVEWYKRNKQWIKAIEKGTYQANYKTKTK